MTSIIISMPPGARPSELGWYVVRAPNSSQNTIIHYDPIGAAFAQERYGRLDPIDEHIFIARIFLEQSTTESKSSEAGAIIPDINPEPNDNRSTDGYWAVRASRVALESRWIRVRADDCTTPSGADVSPYYVIEAPDFVHVVATDTTGRIVLVRQYRHGLGDFSLELPGGVMDRGDGDAVVTARRELEEETGYIGGIVERCISLSIDPARFANQVHFIRLTGVVPGLARPEATESIEVVLTSRHEALQLSTSGGIKNACHLGALLATLMMDG